MTHDIKTKLLSNVIISTKPNRVTYKLPSHRASPIGAIVSISAAAAAGVGLLMFVIDRLKILF
jgi:hypothetical protein